MGKHTPGPWTMVPSKDGSGDIGIKAPDVRNVVAECFAAMREATERSPEVEANARLIAAAPEMLAALKALVAVHRQQDSAGVLPADKAIAYGQAVDAIAKAGA